MLPDRNDLEYVEMSLLGMVHCEKSVCRIEPILKWDLLKEAVKMGISERRAREALRYLEHKGYFDPERLSIDEYVLSEKGKKYFEQLVSDFSGKARSREEQALLRK